MTTIADSRHDQIFPVLDTVQIETAKRFASAAPRRFAPDELIYDIGDRNVPSWLLLEGTIKVARRNGLGKEAIIVEHSAGRLRVKSTSSRAAPLSAAAHAGPQGCLALPFDAAHNPRAHGRIR